MSFIHGYLMRKHKRWKRRNRHKNTGLYNSFLYLERSYLKRGNKYVKYLHIYGFVVATVGDAWVELVYHYKQNVRNIPSTSN